MPTGYTVIIEEKQNVTFRDYAMRCARAFGACVMQRDESVDNPPRPREVSDYHSSSLKRWRGKLLELNAIDPSGPAAKALFDAHCAEVEKLNRESAAALAKQQAAYASMRAQVEAWAPPTADHVEMKAFMLEQIDLCYRPTERPYELAVSESAEKYIAELRDMADSNVAYHEEEHRKEIERCEASARWLKALDESLPR